MRWRFQGESCPICDLKGIENRTLLLLLLSWGALRNSGSHPGSQRECWGVPQGEPWDGKGGFWNCWRLWQNRSRTASEGSSLLSCLVAVSTSQGAQGSPAQRKSAPLMPVGRQTTSPQLAVVLGVACCWFGGSPWSLPYYVCHLCLPRPSQHCNLHTPIFSSEIRQLKKAHLYLFVCGSHTRNSSVTLRLWPLKSLSKYHHLVVK